MTPAPCAPVPNVNDKCPDWVADYDGPGAATDEIGLTTLVSRVVATSPNGRTVYVAGKSDSDARITNKYDYAVIAYDVATGNQRWLARYAGTPDLPQAAPAAVVVDLTGSKVIVTGTISSDDGSTVGIATVAFAADSGDQLWVSVFQEPTLTTTTDAAISPDGARAYVVGQVYFQDTDGSRHSQAVTLAYDAATGTQLWVARYLGNTGDRTYAQKIAANPDGSRVYVGAGKVDDMGFTSDIVLLVYDSFTGELKAETHHLGPGFLIAGLVVSPDGSRVFIARANYENRVNVAFTIAYDAAGTELWMARSTGCTANGCSSRPWYNNPIAVSPDGSRVFVSSLNYNPQTEIGFVTVAYDSVSGEEMWSTRYEAGDLADCFCSPPVTVNPNGEEVYISGLADFVAAVPGGTGATTGNATTLAYDSLTGAQKWVGVYAPAAGSASPEAIAVAPYDDRIFVAGYQEDTASGNIDLFSLTYETGFAASLRPINVHSRKTHGSAGVFDINLPVAGLAGIESRSGGQFAGHEVVFRFADPVTASNATVTPGDGQTGELEGPPRQSAEGREVILDLANVSDAQTLTIGLSGVSNGTISGDVSVRMGVLLGDVNGSRRVDAADVSSVRQQTLQMVTNANFRNDINGSGRIDAADVSIARQQTLTSLP
jgi:hypothetical protein